MDFHWRCELNAFEQFWRCFQEALKTGNHWNGQSDLKQAAAKALGDILPDSDGLTSHIDLGLQFDAASSKQQEFPRVTLTEVIAMKLYCDLLLLKSAVTSLEQRGDIETSERAT